MAKMLVVQPLMCATHATCLMEIMRECVRMMDHGVALNRHVKVGVNTCTIENIVRFCTSRI